MTDIGRGVKGFFDGSAFKGNTHAPRLPKGYSSSEMARAKAEFNRQRQQYADAGLTKYFSSGKTWEEMQQIKTKNFLGGSALTPALYLTGTRNHTDYTKLIPFFEKNLPLLQANERKAKLPPAPPVKPPPPAAPPKSVISPSVPEAHVQTHRYRGGSRLSQEQLDATIASESYNNKDLSHKDARLSEINGYKYDSDLSSDRHAVYYNSDLHKAYIGYRGTANKVDVKSTWGQIAAGKLDKDRTGRIDEAKSQYDKVLYKYGVKPRVTGHSLGGTISQIISKDKGAHGAGFNAGSSTVGGVQGAHKNFDLHRIHGDAVSGSSKFMNNANKVNNYRPDKGKNAYESHLMTNFTNPDSDFWKIHSTKNQTQQVPKSKPKSKSRSRSITQRRRRRGH
jgi:hypothetical protein